MAEVWSLGAIFDAVCAAADPDLPALIHDGAVTTWSALDRRSRALAAAFHAAGAQPGDRLAHLMRNGPAYMQASVAGFRSRLVHVNVNYRYTGEELFYILDNSDAAVVVFDAEFAEVLGTLRDRLNVKLWVQVGGATADFAINFEALATADARLERQDHAADDMFFIYTGGTTGMPKGVMWDQGDLWQLIGGGLPGQGLPAPANVTEHAANVAAGIGRLRALVLPPLMHGTGFLVALNTLAKGGTVVTLPGSGFDAEDAVRTCADLACDYAVIVGDAFGRPMLKALDAGSGSIATLNGMISSGTMWSSEVKAGLLRHAPNAMLVDALASSEGLGAGTSIQTAANAGAPTAFSNDGNTIVVDDQLRRILPGSGVAGRIARAGHLPRGYWRDEAKTAATFPVIDGVRHVVAGDWAIPEADGTLTLLGRGSQCINSGGEKIFPEEVEEALKTHPAVDDALVFGVADEVWGQAVTAVVETCAPVEAEALRLHVRSVLAGYKTPKRIVTVAKVPRAPNGKADYDGAKRLAGAGG